MCAPEIHHVVKKISLSPVGLYITPMYVTFFIYNTDVAVSVWQRLREGINALSLSFSTSPQKVVNGRSAQYFAYKGIVA